MTSIKDFTSANFKSTQFYVFKNFSHSFHYINIDRFFFSSLSVFIFRSLKQIFNHHSINSITDSILTWINNFNNTININNRIKTMNEDGGASWKKMEPRGPPAGSLGGVAKTASNILFDYRLINYLNATQFINYLIYSSS